MSVQHFNLSICAICSFKCSSSWINHGMQVAFEVDGEGENNNVLDVNKPSATYENIRWRVVYETNIFSAIIYFRIKHVQFMVVPEAGRGSTRCGETRWCGTVDDVPRYGVVHLRPGLTFARLMDRCNHSHRLKRLALESSSQEYDSVFIQAIARLRRMPQFC